MQMGVESLLYITEDECEENEEAILSKKNFDITEKITFFMLGILRRFIKYF